MNQTVRLKIGFLFIEIDDFVTASENITSNTFIFQCSQIPAQGFQRRRWQSLL